MATLGIWHQGHFQIKADGSVFLDNQPVYLVRDGDVLKIDRPKQNFIKGLVTIPCGGYPVAVDNEKNVYINGFKMVKTNDPFVLTQKTINYNGMTLKLGYNESKLKIGDVTIENQDDRFGIDGFRATFAEHYLTEKLGSIELHAQTNVIIENPDHLASVLTVGSREGAKITLPNKEFEHLQFIIQGNGQIEGNGSSVDKANFRIVGCGQINNFKIKTEADLMVVGAGQFKLSKEKETKVKSHLQIGTLVWN